MIRQIINVKGKRFVMIQERELRRLARLDHGVSYAGWLLEQNMNIIRGRRVVKCAGGKALARGDAENSCFPLLSFLFFSLG